MKLPLASLLLCCALPLFAADAPPADSSQPQIPFPPPGISVPDDVRLELANGAASLAGEIESLHSSLLHRPDLLPLLPDVEIFQKAVDWALRYNEFFDAKQFETARKLLALGKERAASLRDGKAPWNSQTGLVVRGYRSAIDNSVQPYGLIVPDDWTPADKKPRRLDFWFHGRGEKLTELSFIDDRLKNKGEFTPAGAFVLHLYGRFCNANKFAGEADLFEAWNNANTHYPIDPNRVLVRGFSMGGASTWQFATHHAGLWAAAAPGAGFGESAEFLHALAPGKEPPPKWEQTLWRWYDSTIYASNLSNCPTVAYSGEIDGQRQAANIMAQYLEKEGLTLEQVIGPQTGHKYHPDAKPKINAFVDAAAEKGRPEHPNKIHLTTYTLIYPDMRWVRILGMDKEWERADVDAEVVGQQLVIKTKNVSALQITNPVANPNPAAEIHEVVLDGVPVAAAWSKLPNGTLCLLFQKQGDRWSPGYSAMDGIHPRKSPAICGPIDHAFMSGFLFVRPSGKAFNPTLSKWLNGEFRHAVAFWRSTFRGDVPIKRDIDLDPDDIAHSNLILWGDPSSNAFLRRIQDKLPIKWDAQKIEVAGKTYDSADHAPVFIYPNPLSPNHYIVVNSGPTFREKALYNNADQTAKLPDWAVIDLQTPPGPQWPGAISDAGFFNEDWGIK